MKLPAWITTATAALSAALLPACDYVNMKEIKVGLTTQAEIRARMGEPGFVHWNDDGTATWEYARQPNGSHCYMITFGQDQIVSKLEQALNEQNYARIRDGLSKDDVRRILAHPLVMIGSDGLPHDKHPHPRLWGTFPRVLGHYARDVGLFPLEEAVRKMTALPAERFKLKDRGTIAVGAYADLVLFDPATVLDSATFEQPIAPARGIGLLLVNGAVAYAGNQARETRRNGRFLKRA